ncbi:hypothetical protein BY996DRAFT_6412288 [Phakopsora pachyrhizi]|nr:hypothetical protein BY996DRAFT_6412288 [Phakopsora pachyrhizi]
MFRRVEEGSRVLTINVVGSGVIGLTICLELLEDSRSLILSPSIESLSDERVGEGQQGEEVLFDDLKVNLITKDVDSSRWIDLSDSIEGLDSLEFKADSVSPWAGAFWLSFYEKAKDQVERRFIEWEMVSFFEFLKIYDQIKISNSSSSPLMKVDCWLYFDHQLKDDDLPWYMEICPEARRLNDEELKGLPVGKVDGIRLKTISINPIRYLSYLHQRLSKFSETKNFEIINRQIESIHEAFGQDSYNNDDELDRDLNKIPRSNIVVNATGLGSLTLEGVKDSLVEPIRGQTILIKPPRPIRFSTRDKSTSTYIISRPLTLNTSTKAVDHRKQKVNDDDEDSEKDISQDDEEVILGGCYQVGNFDLRVDEKLSRRIIENCLKIRPDLSIDGTVEGVKVLKTIVGLRPSRRTGPRLEIEILRLKNKFEADDFDVDYGSNDEKVLVHCYGIGGAGFQVE